MKGEITFNERIEAKRLWLINEQSQIKDNNLKQLEFKLGAYRDKDDVLRLKGRLENADLNESSKFPILIPKESYLGDLIILDAHREVLHYGMKDTLNQVRSEYWLVQGRSKVRTVLNKCTLCRKFEAKPLMMMPSAPLPDFRVTCCDPFTNIGIDHLGPLHVYPTPSTGEKVLQKVYVVMITCANSRAIHLELVPDTSCASLINCLKRFFSRRGCPALVVSDNAKCFVAVELKRFLRLKGIEWKYILEVSPWWGGFYERMIKTVKRALKKVLGKSNVTFDELMTIIIEIEAVVNSRPLCYLYSDEANEVLTPSHLLSGKRLLTSRIPVATKTTKTNETEITMNNRVKYLSILISHYETRWKKEYLTELREYQKNNNRMPSKQIKIGKALYITF